ncbi:MAG: hypothetical protein M1445_16380 [Bacteroidetes bacterium]|nr:hypothetical protein [Bacteroidota bacterium]MCL6103687.1 hypothetical protein [Bacteroidota bacterium]
MATLDQQQNEIDRKAKLNGQNNATGATDNPEDMPQQFTQQDAQPQPAPQPDQRVAKAEEYTKRFFSAELPKPKFDQAKADRLQKLQKVNQIVRGVGVMGDILSLGLGANVRKAAPDTTTSRLQQALQANMDKYANDQEMYDIRNFQKAREDAKFGISFEMRDEANKIKREGMAAKTENDKALAAQHEKEFEVNTGFKIADLTERKNYHQAMEDIYRKRGGKSGRTGGPTSIMTSSGKKYQITPEELSYLTNEATGNEAIQSDPKFSNWFTKTEITKQVPNARWGGYDKVPTGQFTYKLKPSADKHALAQSMIDLWEQGKISLPGRKDQPRNENNPTVQAPPPPVPGTVTGPAVGKWAPQTQPNNKFYSTGGYY